MEYIPNFLFKNRHISTIYPNLFRKIDLKYTRERIFTEDNDFLDIDWVKNGNEKLIILCHGLAGNSKSKYILGTGKYFSDRGWDILAMNYRGCSGEMNKNIFFYSMGQIKDLETILNKCYKYKKIVLIGFSLGAVLILNYLGKNMKYPDNLISAIAVAPPCDVYGSSIQLENSSNFIYKNYFLKKLKKKINEKLKIFPEMNNLINVKKLLKIKSLVEFDEHFTAKIYGYKDAKEYYEDVKPLKYLNSISVPTLILMAKDDPIMSESCFPKVEDIDNKYINLDITKYGGHVGYGSIFSNEYWLEKRIYNFVKDL